MIDEDQRDEHHGRRPGQGPALLHRGARVCEEEASFLLGEYSWLTVVSPDDPDGTELSLEPDEHPAARPFKRALVEDGIPFTSFAVGDVAAEHERLVGRGVRFTQPPTDMGPVTTAVFDDTCGNLIQIAAETV